MNKKIVAFRTFGCKLNFAETSAIARKFTEDGYQIVNYKNQADIYVINSCLVTSNAERKCRAAIRQLKKNRPDSFVAVIGCFSELKSEELLKNDGVNLILGNEKKFRLLEFIENHETYDLKQQSVYTGFSKEPLFFSAFSSGDRTRSFLKVQDGCDYKCSYCTVASARGRSRSDTIENVVESANKIALSGIKEIILTGVNIGDFSKNSHETFYQLIRELDKVKGIERFRISSIEPDLLNNEIIEFVARSDKFLPHFHIPLQSGSNKILKSMQRRYKRELFEERIGKIKSLMPHCLVAVDVIAGFPGESDENFEETFNFLKKVDISYIHVFTYSERQNTKAIEIKEIIPGNVRRKRSQKLRQLSEIKKNTFYKRNINYTTKVLFEKDNHNGYIHGFSDNYIRVKTKHQPLLINKIVEVILTEMDDDGDFIYCP